MQAPLFLAVLLGVQAAYLTDARAKQTMQTFAVASTFISPHSAMTRYETIKDGDVDTFVADYVSYDWATMAMGNESLFVGVGTGRFIADISDRLWYEETYTYLFPDNRTTLTWHGASHWIPYHLVRAVTGGTGAYLGAHGQGYFMIVEHPQAGVIVCGNITIVTPTHKKMLPAGFNDSLPMGY